MEMVLIARFHAREGCEERIAAALKEQVTKVLPEPGCLSIHAYGSTRDPRRFFIHSRWANEAAFDVHAGLPNTVAFVTRMEQLIDHPFDANRLVTIA
jgi:quinol monooxygenase YgiN